VEDATHGFSLVEYFDLTVVRIEFRSFVQLPPLLAWAIMPVYLEIVSPLENIVEDLKSLPPARLEVAADFVHRLKRISEEERQAVLAQTAGSLSPEDADAMERAIEEGCEQINEHGW
jgi:hypothetical protein